MLFCLSSRDLTRLLKVSNSFVNFNSLSSFSSISARRAFVDLHFGQPWLSSSKTSSSVCELPSCVACMLKVPIITDAVPKLYSSGRRLTADRQLDGISECSAAGYYVSYFSCGSTVSCREEQP